MSAALAAGASMSVTIAEAATTSRRIRFNMDLLIGG
jgi:hypothetical protein